MKCLSEPAVNVKAALMSTARTCAGAAPPVSKVCVCASDVNKLVTGCDLAGNIGRDMLAAIDARVFQLCTVNYEYHNVKPRESMHHRMAVSSGRNRAAAIIWLCSVDSRPGLRG